MTNIRFIEEAEHEKGTFGWFQMDCIVGKEHQSACLTFTEEKSLYKICFKLDHHNSEEVNKAIKSIFKNKLYKENIKGIITDRGKEFSNWKGIEKITGTNVYFYDPGLVHPNKNLKLKEWIEILENIFLKEQILTILLKKKLIKLWKLLMKNHDRV